MSSLVSKSKCLKAIYNRTNVAQKTQRIMASTEVSVKRNIIVLIKPLIVPVFSQKAFDSIISVQCCYRPLGVRFPALYFFPSVCYPCVVPFNSVGYISRCLTYAWLRVLRLLRSSLDLLMTDRRRAVRGQRV